MIFVLYHILNDFLIIIYICSFPEFQQFSLPTFLSNVCVLFIKLIH